MTTGYRRPIAIAALAATVLLVVPATAVHASPGPTPAATGNHTTAARLPRPTGPYAVGTEALHLTDRSRTDPWVPEAGPRELMVSLYYPARPGGRGATAPYMSTEEARLMLTAAGLGSASPTGVSSLRTHARTDAPTAPGRFPLVLLSPGFGNPRATLTSLAEDLASRGYVVASVDHAHESTGTALPDGRMLECAACDLVMAAPDEETVERLNATVSTGRGTDLSFVLGRLTGHHPAWRHARMIDPSRVAVAGHSIGGNAAASAMLADRRFDAGINLDGAFFAPIPATGLGGRPFLMLGTGTGHGPGGTDDTWDEAWQRLDGWKRWLTVEGAHHSTFTDVPFITERLGVPVDPAAPLSADRSARITRAYVAAFLDQHLRGRPRPLLDGPSPGNPEVVFQHP
ncbi:MULTISPECIES: alpha/beta hydrolase family protein [Streptomyces]|uniref:Alpha/beta hydrolase family protein n=1 Tax=Streptomyces flavovirens TaxID=52258 RepID=A0ABV8NC47_9ACTN|nr:alpha/beta hydrolase [Streptomyces sp. MBT51]MBK3591087.1 alpha/beta hydrolase [Streptomyces sp. MBT51]